MDCVLKICGVGMIVFHCFNLISGRFLKFGPLITAATNHRDRRVLLQLTARTSTKHRCGLVASTWPLSTKVGISKIYPNILRSYESKSQTVWPIAVLDLFFYGYSLQSAAKSRRLSGPNNWLGQKVKIVPTVQHWPIDNKTDTYCDMLWH